MNNEQIDWKRVDMFLRQRGAQLGKSPADIQVIHDTLHQLSQKCGQFPSARKMLQRVGACLLHGNTTIIAPACPDYSHENGRYTFKSLSGGISLLTQRHITFLKEAMGFIPSAKIIILLADHEADDPELCQAVKKSREEFLCLLAESLRATQEEITPLGWTAMYMTEAIPDLVARECEIAEWITSQRNFQERISRETSQRRGMYHKIYSRINPSHYHNCIFNPRAVEERMRIRTINTAAQYVALGQWAAANGHLICNHTTVNLNWYLQTGAAVIHNPAAVY